MKSHYMTMLTISIYLEEGHPTLCWPISLLYRHLEQPGHLLYSCMRDCIYLCNLIPNFATASCVTVSLKPITFGTTLYCLILMGYHSIHRGIVKLGHGTANSGKRHCYSQNRPSNYTSPGYELSTINDQLISINLGVISEHLMTLGTWH
jgi:hypothetical protein